MKALGCLVMTLAGVAASVPCSAQPQGDPPVSAAQEEAGSGDNEYSAVVTIRRALLKEDGTVVRSAADVRYRWERSRTPRGWRSVLTVLPASPAQAGSDATAFGSPVSRIENDEDGSPLRVYDKAGRLMALPSVDLRRILGEPAPGVLDAARASFAAVNARKEPTKQRPAVSQSLVARRADRERRRLRLEGEFGRPVGRLGGFDRYISTIERGSVEVLADPDSAVPVEVNVTRDGRLASHVTYAYGADSTGSIFTRAIHSEHLVSPSTEERAQVDVEFGGIAIGEGR